MLIFQVSRDIDGRINSFDGFRLKGALLLKLLISGVAYDS